MYPVKHDNGRVDSRYTITSEYCGVEGLRYIVRFCGEWLCDFKNEDWAINFAIQHNSERIRYKNETVISTIELENF